MNEATKKYLTFLLIGVTGLAVGYIIAHLSAPVCNADSTSAAFKVAESKCVKQGGQWVNGNCVYPEKGQPAGKPAGK